MTHSHIPEYGTTLGAFSFSSEEVCVCVCVCVCVVGLGLGRRVSFYLHNEV